MARRWMRVRMKGEQMGLLMALAYSTLLNSPLLSGAPLILYPKL